MLLAKCLAVYLVLRRYYWALLRPSLRIDLVEPASVLESPHLKPAAYMALTNVYLCLTAYWPLKVPKVVRPGC